MSWIVSLHLRGFPDLRHCYYSTGVSAQNTDLASGVALGLASDSSYTTVFVSGGVTHTSTVNNAPTEVPPSTSKSATNNIPAIVGAVIGVLCLLVMVVGLCLYRARQSQRRKKRLADFILRKDLPFGMCSSSLLVVSISHANTSD